MQLRSNLVSADTGGGMKSVHINGISVLSGLNLGKTIRAFFPQGQGKLS